MDISVRYNGGLTSEQFLFYEMRIVAKQYLEAESVDNIIEYVTRDNLFQYPTERKISKFVRACHRRIVALGNEKLVCEVANAPVEVVHGFRFHCYEVLSERISLGRERFRNYG